MFIVHNAYYDYITKKAARIQHCSLWTSMADS